MKLHELRESVRSTLRDNISTTDAAIEFYWSDADLNEYLNEGYNIFCRSTKIIRDSLSPMCSLTVALDAQHIALSPLVIDIERAKASWSSTKLTRTTVDELDEDDPEWIGKAGVPSQYTLEFSSNYLTLDRKASAAGTIALTIRRMPLVEMTAATDVPEFKAQYHWMLKDYALFRAFMKQDSETYNPEKGNYHRNLFMGEDETSPGGHILKVITEIDPLPTTRKASYF